MYRQEAKEEYEKALRLGQKAYKAALAEGRRPHPEVLDELVDGTETAWDVGTVQIPIDQIVGIKSAGRITAFSPEFYPLLEERSEFAYKWVGLCAAHLSTGIRDPIT